MIDYSVFLMSNPMKPAEEPKAYATNQVKERITLQKFVSHIADHNGVFTRGTVKGVVSDLCECLVEQLLAGNKVQLGELGDFSLSLSCTGAPSMKEFTANHIKEVNIVFTPGEDFANLRSRAEFNSVPSRLAQAATLKAEKTGEGTVDLLAAKKRPAADTDSENV